MDRTVWVRADDAVGDWETRRARITAGIEAGVDWVLADIGDVERVRELGDVRVAAFVAPGADVETGGGGSAPDLTVVGKNSEGDGSESLPESADDSADIAALERDGGAGGAFVRVRSEADEAFAAAAAGPADTLLVAAEDWQVIPLENLIATVGDDAELVAGVASAEEARTAFETLELGVDGVLVDSDDPDEIRGAVEARDALVTERLDLDWGTVRSVERVGSADRVCVDTGSLLDDDEGMLVGSMSRGLLFVHAETADSPYVAPRPFRVNAGAVHAYVRTPGGETKYLSELGSGDEVLVVDGDGDTRRAVVGRVKIETRPMFRVEVDVDGDTVETLLQNAETIKVETRDGPTAVTDLAEGDEVKVFYEPVGRHFGSAVDERIIEQ